MKPYELVEKLGALSNRISDFTAKTSIPIHNKLISVGHPNRSQYKLNAFKSINVHYTGNEDPKATDTINAAYFGRPYTHENGEYYEKGSRTKFRYGSTQILFDNDSGTLALPLNNVSWAVGDRPQPYTEEFKGQNKLAKYLFNNRQNYESLNIEICNNDVIKNSVQDWLDSVDNVKKFIIWVIKELGLTFLEKESLHPETIIKPFDVGNIVILRHYDITGKKCPQSFVDDQKAWNVFLHDIADATK